LDSEPGHTHVPVKQPAPLGQLCPQKPQFNGSLDVSAQ
jgi:hypothetical protein